MSKVRRPRHQRQGSKPHPNPALPASAARHETVDPPAESAVTDPSATDAQGEPAAFAAEAAPADEPSVRTDPVSSPALRQDATEPGNDAPVPAMAPSLPPMTPRQGAESFGSTVMNYFIGEGEAIAAHWRALSGARSMGEVVRLQIGEFQRAADATLTCWGVLTLVAGRTVAAR